MVIRPHGGGRQKSLQRIARRRGVLKGYRLWVMGYRMGLFGTIVRNGGDAAPERPNIKEKTDAKH